MSTFSNPDDHAERTHRLGRKQFLFFFAFLSMGLIVTVQAGAQSKTSPIAEQADGNKETTYVSTALLEEDGGNLGACIKLRGAIENPKAGHVYELRYLIRSQDEANTEGIMLGDKDRPSGVCYTAMNSQGLSLDQYGKLQLVAEVDITRSLVRQLYNMPKPDKWCYAVLRVEPHIFDTTLGEYVSEKRPDSAIMIASLKKGGYVLKLQSLGNFLRSRRSFGKSEFVEICRILENLDHFDCSHNELPNALAELLDAEHLGDEIHLMLLKVIQRDWVRGPKEELEGTLELLGRSTNESIRERANFLLDQE